MAKKKPAGGEESETGTPAPASARPYVVLARKYRPQTFDDLIGQDVMVRTLRNAFASGRIAQGYMLTGVRGVGKTTTARILARALNYETDTVTGPSIDMPVLGRHCAEIMDSRHPDVIEMDAASNTGVENMKEIIENARYRPILARMKVFIIDEVHMLSKSAFNALLKTLEEPPEHVKFIFATTEIGKVPVTVLSRCQRFDLRRIEVQDLSAHLGRIAGKEGATVESAALGLIARAAGGSVRDGLSILDQAIAMGSGQVTVAMTRDMLGLAHRGGVFDLLEALLSGTPVQALGLFSDLHKGGAEPLQLLTDLAETVHLVTRTKVLAGSSGAGEGLPQEDSRGAAALAERMSMPLLARVWQMLLKGLDEGGRAPDPLAAAEMVLIRIAYAADLPPPDEILKALGGGQTVRRAVPAGSSAPPPERESGRTVNEAPVDAGWVSEGSAPEPDGSFFDAAGNDLLTAEDVDAVEGLGDEDDAPGASLEVQALRLNTFEDVISLAGQKRDARLGVHLEEHVSLVKFDAAAGSIDLFLLDGAPPEMANELREKLNRWTGRRWVVMLSKEAGAPPAGEVRRQREAAELETLKRHPAVAALFEAFPDAKVAAVRHAASRREDETGTG